MQQYIPIKYTTDFSRGISSPLYGINGNTTKLHFTASSSSAGNSDAAKHRSPGVSEARHLKSLFDGLSPVKNGATATEMQRRFQSLRGNAPTHAAADETRALSGHTKLCTHLGFTEEKESDVQVAKILTSGPEKTCLAAGATSAHYTPFKARQTAMQVKNAQDMHSINTELELLRSINLTPGFDELAGSGVDLRGAVSLLAPTPVPVASKSSTRATMLTMTPGDALILGKHSEAESDFIATMPPLPSHEYFHTPSASNRTQNARKVLFAESPPTPPMLTLSPPGQVAAMGFTSSLLDKDTLRAEGEGEGEGEVCERESGRERDSFSLSPRGSCRSPRAHLLKSASKQLSNVMDMLQSVSVTAAAITTTSAANTVTFASPSAPVPAAAVFTPTDENAEYSTLSPVQNAPLFVKPASWTPLREEKPSVSNNVAITRQGGGGSAAKSKSCSKSAHKNVGKSSLGPAVRMKTPVKSTASTPGKGGIRTRETMLSHVIYTRPATEVPSPFKCKTPLKRSPVKAESPSPASSSSPAPADTNMGTPEIELESKLGSRLAGVEVSPKAITPGGSARERAKASAAEDMRYEELKIQQSMQCGPGPVDLSIIETGNCSMSGIMEQPVGVSLKPTAVSSVLLTGHMASSAGMKNIKMATDLFAVQESPIGMPSKTKKNITPIVTSRCSADDSDNNDADDEDDTVPLADLIKQSIALHPGSPAATSPLQATTAFNNWNRSSTEKTGNNTSKLNTTSDSTKKYRVMMADCSDLLSEIENMLV